MSIVTVNLVDTFDEWRIKTNSLGTETGDLTGLSTTDTSSIVAAINEVDANADLGLKNIVEDITPELGGNLNIGSNDILERVLLPLRELHLLLLQQVFQVK